MGEGKNAGADLPAARPIRILIIGPSIDTIVGGQSVQVSRLIEKLNNEPGIVADLQTIAPRFLPRLQSIKYLRTFLRGTRFLFDIATRIPKYDIIHICSAAHFSFLLAPTPAVLLSRMYGKRTILNYRSGQLEEHYQRWRHTLMPTLRLFDRIVTPSNYLVDVFAGYGVAARSIHNIIDTEQFIYRDRVPLRPVFFSNRLLERLYNIPCILRAFRILQDRYQDARLVVAGHGDQREHLENYARELALRNVEFVGKVSQMRMAELYNNADIYLNSPDTDNMPGSILECYASGLPVVTTGAGGIPYILEHEKTGLMVPIDDHEALALEATRLLEDPELARNVIANARVAVKKYSWDEVGPQWISTYQELVNGARDGRSELAEGSATRSGAKAINLNN